MSFEVDQSQDRLRQTLLHGRELFIAGKASYEDEGNSSSTARFTNGQLDTLDTFDLYYAHDDSSRGIGVEARRFMGNLALRTAGEVPTLGYFLDITMKSSGENGYRLVIGHEPKMWPYLSRYDATAFGRDGKAMEDPWASELIKNVTDKIGKLGLSQLDPRKPLLDKEVTGKLQSDIFHNAREIFAHHGVDIGNRKQRSSSASAGYKLQDTWQAIVSYEPYRPVSDETNQLVWSPTISMCISLKSAGYDRSITLKATKLDNISSVNAEVKVMDGQNVKAISSLQDMSELEYLAELLRALAASPQNSLIRRNQPVDKWGVWEAAQRALPVTELSQKFDLIEFTCMALS